jgi:hypothetical protein
MREREEAADGDFVVQKIHIAALATKMRYRCYLIRNQSQNIEIWYNV